MSKEIIINLNDMVIPKYQSLLDDILDHKYSEYMPIGGRGSTKSSFVGGRAIPLLIINNPNTHALCLRKVANTVQDSIFSEVVKGIYYLGLEDLFKIPERYNTAITYIPTGQKIYFRGADKPEKIKSISPKFGHIGILWFEELDQFSGENEIRNIRQSVVRGNGNFWTFYTFNPPISMNNWANVFVDICETNENKRQKTVVVRNTYLDVPPEWLGSEFIEQAEELKEINPNAYEHEYLGKAVGTGGNVFPNVSDLDMNKPVDGSVWGYDRQIPLWRTFDKIYNGIDWGFALDPTRFVRLHYDRKCHDIYIFAEYSTAKTRSVDIYNALYNEKKLINNNELLTADSGGGGTFANADFKAYGAFIRAAEKGPDSVSYGIKWLQGLRNIYIDKRRCPETYKEFVLYEYEQDRDGNFISAYPDENNHSIDAVRYALEKYYKKRGN